MAIAFTPEQEKVMNLRDRNILVSAAAGSGKTAVLVERIVRMVCDENKPVDIDRLLIVTFTSAAAAEMRERIDLGIAEKLRENPESEHIQRQAALLHNAQITTIDSFCLFIVRNHFHEIGLDPAFRVADENEVKLLKQDVMSELLEDAFSKGEEDFLHCVEFFCPNGKESALEDNIFALSNHALSCAFPREWLLERKKDYLPGENGSPLTGEAEQYLLHYVRAVLEGAAEAMGEVQRICELPDGPYMYGETVEAEKEMLESLLFLSSYQEYEARIPNIAFGRLPGKKDDSVDPGKRELAKKLRDGVKDSLQKLEEKFFRTSHPLALQRAAACRQALEVLIDLTIEFDERVQKKKAEKKIIDFSDMEHFALDILLTREAGVIKPSKVAEEYKQFFHEILIDEYQDSNLTQEALLEAVSGAGNGRNNRFMVGDVKQSIYGFRQARPDLFLEKYDTYPVDGEENIRIDLSKNYRSRAEVVNTVNSVFERIMSKEVGGIEYDENAKLYARAEYVESEGNESEFLLIETPEKEDELNAKQAEAKAIALKIKELKKTFRVMDKATKNLRPVRFSDMVILLRGLAGWEDEFKKVMEGEGIPVYVTSKTGYFAATEVRTLLQLLRVLDNPRQDIPLYGTMKSLFGGFDEEEIAVIRAKHQKGSLYEALQEALQETGDEKLAVFLKRLNQYRSYTAYMPIRELLQCIVEDYDYLNYVTAMPGGNRRRANVEMLFTKASDFEKTSYFGLFHFVRYMEQLEKYEVDYGEADLLDENADVVRIMTIHKSKGLEFPVTFVAGLGKQFNAKSVQKKLIIDSDMGVGMQFVDPESRILSNTLRQNVVAQKMWEDNLAEELRILYVALTRAKEKLILTASAKNVAELWQRAQENPVERLGYVRFITAKSYVDFLLPILAGAELEVSILQQEDLLSEAMEEQMELALRQTLLDRLDEALEEKDEAFLALQSRLSYSYPHKNLENLYTKTSVSELKAQAMEESDAVAHEAFEQNAREPYIPKFCAGEKKVAGALRGSAFHRAMELLDFDALLGECIGELPASYEEYVKQANEKKTKLLTAIQDFLEQKRASQFLSQEYFEVINPRKILSFLTKECAYRMWRAQRKGDLFREKPFVLGLDAGILTKRFGEDAPEGENVLVQGIIDAFWIEEDALILLDYKTDKIEDTGELWNRYESQMYYYIQALTRILGKPVSETILYSVSLDEESIRREQ